MFRNALDFPGLHSTGPSNKNLPPLKLVEVTERFTVTQLKTLKASKSCGLDNLSPRMFKDSSEVIAKRTTN